MKKILLLAATIFCFTNIINAQAGQLDPSFGTNGVVKTPLGKSYNRYQSFYQILPLPDGSMYTIDGEDVGRLKKRLSNGRVDTIFGSNGNFDNSGFGISTAAIQPDGKIVAAGGEIVRYSTNGKLDTTFLQNGKRTLGWIANAIAVQKDGKIVVAGDSSNHLALARYNTDGSPDATFDGDGMVNSTLNYNQFFSGGITTVALQNDGKIVAAGAFSMVRYNADGTEDKTFNGNGIHAFQAYLSVVIQNDGKIAAVGLSYNQESASLTAAICRLNTDGTFDKSFSTDGMQQPDNYNNYEAITLALQKDDKIVTTGTVTNFEGLEFFGVTRYKTNGELDSSFSDDGKQVIDFGYQYSKAATVAIQPDGKILAGGNTNYSLTKVLARYNTDGSLDNTFGEDGKLTDSAQLGKAAFYKTIVQKDGKIIASGKAWNGSAFEFVIARYNADGSLDNLFSADGILTTAITTQSENKNAFSAAIQSDGKIVAAGDSYFARYNTDGSLDSAFSGKGLQTVITARSIAIQKDGRILVAGGEIFTTRYGRSSNPAVVRYNADGSLDKTFGIDGKRTIVLNSKYGEATSVLIQNDGKIVAAGAFGGNTIGDNGPGAGPVVLIRLNTDGSLDNTFGNNGLDNFAPYHWSLDCSVAMQKDGRIIAATHDVTHYHGAVLYRLNIDGSLDSSFNTKAPIHQTNSFQNRTSIALQSNGKIVVSGSDLLRYNANGTLDSTFNINAKREVDFDIQDIAIFNNKLYAVGGNYYGSIARYLLDSSNIAPTITLTTPADNTTRLAPAAHIKLSTAASDADDTITKVEFYNGNKLLHTETVIPYGYVWRNVGVGNYTITAKAYDNSGNVSTSAPVHISVVPNKAPIVSITKPVNNQSFAAPGYIHLEAAASDTDGRVTNVKFYNGTTLLRTEYEYPYTYHWENVAAGTYTITAVATDNWGAHTTSAPVTVTVTSANAIVSSRSYLENGKTALKDALRLSLYPNPATNIINLYTKGLQPGKPTDISIISVSGIVLKKVQITSAAQTQLDVSTLAKGVYTIKMVSGDKVMYKQFVKL